MTELIPHAFTSDSHLLPWPQRAAPSSRTLPLPQNTYDASLAVSKQSFVYNQGPLTPPPSTVDMNGLPYPAQQRAQEVSYPVRPHIPAQHVASNGYQSAAVEAPAPEKYIRSSPPGISNLVQGEPQGRQSPSHNNAITAAFKLPSSIKAPQSNLPQLAAEVSYFRDSDLQSSKLM